MKLHSAATLAFAVATLAACATTPRGSASDTPTPMSATQAGASTGSSMQPQTANSLPEGAAVNAPMARDTGIVGTTATSPEGTASTGRPRRPVRR